MLDQDLGKDLQFLSQTERVVREVDLSIQLSRRMSYYLVVRTHQRIQRSLNRFHRYLLGSRNLCRLSANRATFVVAILERLPNNQDR